MITKAGFIIDVPDDLKYELENALEGSDDSIFAGMSELEVQFKVADILDIGEDRVYVERDV